MLRFTLTLLAWALAAFLACTLIVRAYAYEVVEHTFITRDGVTLDCERVVGSTGQVSYENCSRVP